MTPTAEIVSLLLLLVAAWFWQQALRCKEIARGAGSNACSRADVQFLDDTVELVRMRIRRDRRGRLGFVREYRFEFSRDGRERYGGHVRMHGQHVTDLELQPHYLH